MEMILNQISARGNAQHTNLVEVQRAERSR